MKVKPHEERLRRHANNRHTQVSRSVVGEEKRGTDASSQLERFRRYNIVDAGRRQRGRACLLRLSLLNTDFRAAATRLAAESAEH